MNIWEDTYTTRNICISCKQQINGNKPIMLTAELNISIKIYICNECFEKCSKKKGAEK